MSALFSLNSLLVVIAFVICTCSYLREKFPDLINRQTKGFPAVFRRAAVVGDRLSPYVAVYCLCLAIFNLFLR